KPMAICALGGLSNSDQTIEKRKRERREATLRYYTEQEIELAGRYRRIYRKIPGGSMVMNWFYPLRLNLKTRLF
ncbi:MAG: hypothetical protein SFY81_10320, partial [Verrucomicrobiota bacterium]|nr:hypothetical protein [Verrucomicrobiota bacterium]